MKPILALACLLLPALFFIACGASRESSDDGTTYVQSQTASAPPQESRQSMSIATHTDTIATIHQPTTEPEPTPKTSVSSDASYKVQVGAYHKAAHATARENLSKNRFNLSTTSEYSEKLGVYRVRVGAFKTQAEAVAFSRKLRKEYPAEFGDAWIVNLEKESQ